MSEFLPACHNWPPIMMGLACALAAFVVVKWARAEDARLPEWRWGDKPRRPTPNHDDLIAHVIGAVLVASSVVYALNNPICG